MAGKKLSEMSLEELWQLFPIILAPHSKEWAVWYQSERDLLAAVMPAQDVVRISHIGSTAVEAIWAKPTVDILVELQDACHMQGVKDVLLQHGYTCMSESNDRMSLCKGYTQSGFALRVYHLHLRVAGDNDELYFRDYLNDHPEVAAAYEGLKMRLCQEYEHDRDGYTAAKADFIRQYTQKAKRVYMERY